MEEILFTENVKRSMKQKTSEKTTEPQKSIQSMAKVKMVPLTNTLMYYWMKKRYAIILSEMPGTTGNPVKNI